MKLDEKFCDLNKFDGFVTYENIKNNKYNSSRFWLYNSITDLNYSRTFSQNSSVIMLCSIFQNIPTKPTNNLKSEKLKKNSQKFKLYFP